MKTMHAHCIHCNFVHRVVLVACINLECQLILLLYQLWSVNQIFVPS